MNRRALPLVFSALLAALSFPAGAYTVQQGDTLYSLARREGVTVEDLVKLNGLSNLNLSVGQELKLPSEQAPRQLGDVQVQVPGVLRAGALFSVRLTGARAAEARVRFLSEAGTELHSPAEDLAPFGAAGEYAVLGRVPLGSTKPLAYEIRLGDQRLGGSVPVRPRKLAVQKLDLPPALAAKRKDPRYPREESLVEKAYARRTAQAWSKPFLGVSGVQVIATQFGQPRRYTKGEGVVYHNGIDYARPSGTPVLAINDGTVIVAGQYPVRGGLVVVDHGAGLLSLYFHQSKLLVKVGDKVTRGQKIGLVGSTGLSTGPHLHLEVRLRGEPVDPAGLYGKLLP